MVHAVHGTVLQSERGAGSGAAPAGITLALLSAFLLGGCTPAIAARPTPEVIPPPPVVDTPVAPAVPVKYTVPALVTDTRYQLQSTMVLERDSAGQRDTQELKSQADATVRLRRQPLGGFEATGRISGYVVQSALSSTPIALDSLRFDARLDSLALRVVTQPPLANECDRPETGALTLVRDILLRVPGTVTIGDRWRDSTVQVVCRSSLPMIVRTTSEYVAADTVRSDQGMVLVIRRTSQSSIRGKTTSSWRAIEISGTGSGTLEAQISVLSGAVRDVTNTSSMTLTVTDRTTPAAARSQTVTQRVEMTAKAVDR